MDHTTQTPETTADPVFQQEFPVFLEPKEVERRTSLSRSTIERQAKEGSFPSPVRIGDSRKAWIEEEVTSWQMAIISKRDAA